MKVLYNGGSPNNGNRRAARSQSTPPMIPPKPAALLELYHASSDDIEDSVGKPNSGFLGTFFKRSGIDCRVISQHRSDQRTHCGIFSDPII